MRPKADHEQEGMPEEMAQGPFLAPAPARARLETSMSCARRLLAGALGLALCSGERPQHLVVRLGTCRYLGVVGSSYNCGGQTGGMQQRYSKAMDHLNAACLFTAGLCLVVIILIIPYGVFCRYALNSAASWPEPVAVLLMIILSFLSAVVCYREYLHIGVGVLPAFLGEPAKTWLGWFLEACMLATNLFMLWWGTKLVHTTWFQSIPEFPAVSSAVASLPIPIGGALTALYVIERFMTREFFSEPDPDTVSQLSTE